MTPNFKLNRIVEYAYQNLKDLDVAWEEFYGAQQPSQIESDKDKVLPLFNEWLVFEYRPKTGVTFITAYYLSNPDKLKAKELKQLEQVIKTEIFGLFEVKEINPAGWLILNSLFEAKIYKVFDQLACANAFIGGVFLGRIAGSKNKYFFCGNDPIILQTEFDDEVRRHFLEMGKRNKFSITDVINLFLNPEI